MTIVPEHQVENLRTAPGELSFEARVGERAQPVWLRAETELVPSADAALAACLLPAMRSGGRLRLTDPVSPRVLRGQREYQSIQRAWSREWGAGEELREVEVTAPARALEPGPPTGRVAAFFSGGVDSWSTLLENPDVTDLIFVRGFDLIPGAPQHAGLGDAVEAKLGAAAGELGLPLHVVETNLRELSDPQLRWDFYYGCAAATVALFMAPLFERVLIAGDSDYEVQVKFGANWLVDQLWSSEGLEIVDAGGRFSRMQRLARIAGHPVVQRTLRVCWENPGGEYNCGRCRKCLMTMAGLEATGRRDLFTTFPPELDLDAFAAVEITQEVSLALWEDVLDALRAGGRAGGLESAVGEAVARGKRGLGLPRSFRRRRGPAPPPVAAAERPAGAPPPTLFATPETAAAIAGADAVALLVGGYDGSGNFGDVAQLDAALELLAPLGPELLVAPLLERQYLASHRMLSGEMLRPPEWALYFDAGGEHDDDLVPVPAPESLRFAACYLYGGGYLNGFWGERKLAMLGAAEALLAAGGADRIRRVSSGLQADPEWLAGLGPAQAATLRSFDLLGARDPRSRLALEDQLPADVLASADDAIGVLRRFEPDPAAAPGEELRVGVHYAEHSWVTTEGEALLEFQAEFLAELGRLAGAAVVAQPLIAYLDRRVDERPAAARFAGACGERGIEVAPAALLRPATLAATAPELGRCSLALSCSYHVALTALMLGVPTVLVQDSAYYEHKGAGLAAAFGLPEAFATRSDQDPRARARAVAAHLFDAAERATLGERLSAGAATLRRDRELAEAELLGRLGAAPNGHRDANGDGAAAAAIPALAASQRRERHLQRAAELRTAEADARCRAAELRDAQARERLAAVLGSRSWRLTAPLRRLGALGGRR